MLILISPAKTFAGAKSLCPDAPSSTPRFLSEAHQIIADSLRLSAQELGRALALSPRLRDEVYARQRAFFDEGVAERPALLAYSGMVYRKIAAQSFTADEWRMAGERLRMTSFVYGLLRPSDRIRPYRMEGGIHLPLCGEGERLFDYWRDRLTPLLIEEGKQQGGTLLYLASEEMRQLFHWAEVERQLRVLTPTFLTVQPDGRHKQIVVYTKMARGTLTSEVIRRGLITEDEVKACRPEGFCFAPEHSTERDWTFLLPQ